MSRKARLGLALLALPPLVAGLLWLSGAALRFEVRAQLDRALRVSRGCVAELRQELDPTWDLGRVFRHRAQVVGHHYADGPRCAQARVELVALRSQLRRLPEPPAEAEALPLPHLDLRADPEAAAEAARRSLLALERLALRAGKGPPLGLEPPAP